MREDRPPNDRKVSARRQVSKQGVSDSGAVSKGARIDLIGASQLTLSRIIAVASVVAEGL